MKWHGLSILIVISNVTLASHSSGKERLFIFGCRFFFQLSSCLEHIALAWKASIYHKLVTFHLKTQANNSFSRTFNIHLPKNGKGVANCLLNYYYIFHVKSLKMIFRKWNDLKCHINSNKGSFKLNFSNGVQCSYT